MSELIKSDLCKMQENFPKEEIKNHVRTIYQPFTTEQISKKIVQLFTDSDINAEVSIIYNTIENLHQAIPNHRGDWYFTGNIRHPEAIKW